MMWSNLGTKVYDYYSDSREDEYVLGYAMFLQLIKEKNQDAYLFCTLGIMGGEDLFPLIQKAIRYLGDEKIYSFLIPQE